MPSGSAMPITGSSTPSGWLAGFLDDAALASGGAPGETRSAIGRRLVAAAPLRRKGVAASWLIAPPEALSFCYTKFRALGQLTSRTGFDRPVDSSNRRSLIFLGIARCDQFLVALHTIADMICPINKHSRRMPSK